MKRILAAVMIVLAVQGCRSDTDSDPDAVSREGFIAAYVDLRIAGLRTVDKEIRPQDKTRILAEHGLTDQDLIGFVESHDGDVDYMTRLWAEIEAKIDSIRSSANSK